MNYNELKLLILRSLCERGQMDSSSLAKELFSKRVPIDVHALRMALMRYHRLGLLRRERAGGMFIYSLSERGLQRLRWLERPVASEGR